jgi:hypothetical protein
MKRSDRKPGHTPQTLGGTQIQIEVGPISDAANHARDTSALSRLKVYRPLGRVIN